MTDWLTDAEVREYMRISDPKTLSKLRSLATAAGIEPAWIDIGIGRPQYRWDASDVERWVREVGAWRASENAAGRGAPNGPASSSGRSSVRPRCGDDESQNAQDDPWRLGI